jgi:GNAT superfamily N-acetyltransferase
VRSPPGSSSGGHEAGGALVGVIGFQSMLDVDLIRHAYVSPNYQRQGVRSALLDHLARSTKRRMLVGTWAAADWAVRFYHRHGFEPVGPEHTPALLKRYWAIADRRIDASVVLANPPLGEA